MRGGVYLHLSQPQLLHDILQLRFQGDTVRLSREAESAPRVPARGSLSVKVTALLAQR